MSAAGEATPLYARNEFDALLGTAKLHIRDLQVEAENWRRRALAAEERERVLHERLEAM